jgi:hypothetical protein
MGGDQRGQCPHCAFSLKNSVPIPCGTGLTGELLELTLLSEVCRPFQAFGITRSCARSVTRAGMQCHLRQSMGIIRAIERGIRSAFPSVSLFNEQLRDEDGTLLTGAGWACATSATTQADPH